MLPSDVRALLVEAPAGRHLAQLHRDDRSLVASVGLYVSAGLERGAGVVIVATPDHTEAILRYVGRAGLSADALRRSGQFIVLDAEATLARILRGGQPVWSEFQRVIGPVIEHLHRFGRSRCRAYGEMVNVLWSRGQYQAAIQLEEFWNTLGQTLPFALFCSYVFDSRDHRCYQAPLADIGRTHSEIITGDDDEAFVEALDKASRDVFGAPLSESIAAAPEHAPGEHRLPTAQRTMLWMSHALPAASADVLQRARAYLAQAAGAAGSGDG
jgi:hypothetical protein